LKDKLVVVIEVGVFGDPALVSGLKMSIAPCA
jgi:hypothetical protein